MKELNYNLTDWSALTVLHSEGNHWICHCNNLPSAYCDCKGVQKRNTFKKYFDEVKPIPKKSWSSGKILLTIIALILCVAATAFIWRILVKYRRNRTVNLQYPVIYSSVTSGI